jgi:alpha-tubulin suppressor-like RCC1 family protein
LVSVLDDGPQLSHSATHTCALLDNGKVKCWGNNAFGQLGYGDTQNRGLLPTDTPDLLPEIDLGSGRTAVSVAAGGYRTCALLDSGQIKCWGINNYGLLGLGDTQIRGDGIDVNGLPLMDMGDNLPPVVVW